MIFSSIFFIFAFLPIVLFLYYITPYRLKNLVLLIVSLIFYAWGEPVYVVLMIFSILINFVSGSELEHFMENGETQKAKYACISTVVINLFILGFYKYYGFLLDNLNAVLPFEIPYTELALPIGISFYTFQTMSYVIDVYRGKVEAQHNLITFGAYVSMFPQLIAGPIVRYSDVEQQLMHRTFSLEKFGDGVMWFLQGLGKKVLIANNMGGFYESIAALGASNTSILTAWIGCFAYMMQIYFDFGGYSDMAIGLGKMFGFEFMQNFDYPYTSKSITEFWRRWHISLSSWFKEYVYIPLGGNRGTTAKAIRNLMIRMGDDRIVARCGMELYILGNLLWIILIIEKYVLKEVLERLPNVVRHTYTIVLVMFGWVLFFSPSLGSAVAYMGTMLGIGGAGFADAAGFYYLKSIFILGAFSVAASTPFIYKKFSVWLGAREKYKQWACVAIYIGIFLISTAYLVNATYNPFLYFRF